MARLIIRSLLILIVLGSLALVILGFWALRSQGGRDFLMARIANQLPEGSALNWKGLEGNMWDGMVIHDLRYADSKYIFTAQKASLKNALWPLLSKRLDIETLIIENAILTLPQDDEPFELPRWPESLPAIDLPMTIAIDQLHFTHLQIQDHKEKLVLVYQADVAVTLAHGLVALPKLAMTSDRGDLNLRGEYQPREKYRTNLTGNFIAVTAENIAPARITLNAKGDLDDFRLKLSGTAPAALLLDLHLQDGSTQPHWSFKTSSEQLLLEQFGLAPDQPWAFSLSGIGIDGNVKFGGNIKRGEQALQIEPSEISIEAGVLQLTPVLLRVDAGLLRVEGRAQFVDKDPVFDVLISSQELNLLPESADKKNSAVNGSAQMKVTGKFSAWNINGDAVLLRAKEKAVVKISGHGNEKFVLLDHMSAITATGKLQGTGKLFWEPALGAELQASLNQFNPAYFFPDFPGAVNGVIDVHARQNADELWVGDATLKNISGRLRDRALAGEVQMRWNGKNGDGKLSLNIGSSRVKAAGRFGESVDIAANFSPLNLADISPNGGGQLQGSVKISGPGRAPNYKIDLSGDQLRWGKDSLGLLSAKGELPGIGKSGQMFIRASAINISGQPLEQFEAQLSGNIGDMRAQANAASDYGKIKFDISAAGANQNWKGVLHSLQLAPRLGESWSL
ncbi:MAG: hypothetical protein ABIP02_07460, partial [Arenimonas sp.]